MSCSALLVVTTLAHVALSLSLTDLPMPLSANCIKMQRPPTPKAGIPNFQHTLRLRGGASNSDIDLREAASRAATGPLTQWIEENFPHEARKEMGHACLGFGSAMLLFVLTPLPVIGCFLNRTGLLVGNILLASGVLLLRGPDDARRFLLAPRRRPGTFTMLAGFLLIYKRWVLLGVMMELLGFLSLFGPFLEAFLAYLSPFMPTSLRGLVALVRNAFKLWTSAFNRVVFRGASS